MTVTDIRVSYKQSTGNYPYYNYFYDYRTKTKTRGAKKLHFFKTIDQCRNYGKWLEEELKQTPEKSQLEFYNYEKTYPTNTFIKFYVETEIYYQDYINWLEEKLLNKYNNE